MKRTRKLWLLLFAAAAVLAAVGITYSWIARNSAMSTLMKILPPDTITIVPVTEQGVEMAELDLDFQEGSNDKKDEDGTIHILRPICVRSTSPVHRLEIVHTTNLKNLTFQIYPATKTETGFTFDKNKNLSGAYKNQQDSNPKLAKEETLENYESTTDVADVHAYPLYWLAVNCATASEAKEGWQVVTSYTEQALDPETKIEKDFYCTYYYLEISWLENTKETDLFYIIAQNVAE